MEPSCLVFSYLVSSSYSSCLRFDPYDLDLHHFPSLNDRLNLSLDNGIHSIPLPQVQKAEYAVDDIYGTLF